MDAEGGVSGIRRNAAALVDSLVANSNRKPKSLAGISAGLRTATELKVGESALDAVADVLRLPLAAWVPDTSNPYALPQADSYARSRGWPAELLEFWWSRHAALKMPLYIRCRFEHLPFVAQLEDKRHRQPIPISREQARVTAVIRELGVTAFAVVPLHMSKGQVAMIAWAGNRDPHELQATIAGIEGDLLAIGHHFMRIANRTLRNGATELSRRLTPREWDCARTLAQGYREAEIADIIGISKLTVRYHLDNVVEKFGCKTRTQAIALLAQLGLLGPIDV
jgi:DNA-binding CsgD family transcriptional regulator